MPDPVAPYLVMEYVAGSTLRPYCRADQLLSLELIVEIGFKCAMALGYVYRQGLIHRDVKPANLLAVLNNGTITDVKISDFGSVLNLGSDVTQIYRVGSLAYMSPEQLDGGTLDCRADMYSLGAVLYHLIAGRPPFDGAGAVGDDAPDLQRQAGVARSACAPASRAGLDDVIQQRAREEARRALRRLGRIRAGALGPGHDAAGAARPAAGRARLGALQPAAHARVLRRTSATSSCGRWCTARKWQRFALRPRALRKGEEGNSFHIIAQGEVEVFRDGKQVAQLGAGTSVGEMAYLAPSAELKKHSTDVIVTEPATTISFTPETLMQLSPNARHLFHDSFIQRARAAAARGARGAGAPAPDLLGRSPSAPAVAAVGGRCRRSLTRRCRCSQSRPSAARIAPALERSITETSMKQLITLAAALAWRCSTSALRHLAPRKRPMQPAPARR